MQITEKENYPVRYEDILVFPEYWADFGSNIFHRSLADYKDDDINYYVVGVGNTYRDNRTSVLLINSSGQIVGVREKISIFLGEGSDPSTRLVKVGKSKPISSIA